MLNIIKNMGKHSALVLAIVVCLIVQAACDLGLPSYTSDIVDVGIEQGGIRDSVPEVLRENTYEKLKLFLTKEESESMEGAYQRIEAGDTRYLKEYPILKEEAVYLLCLEEETLREQLNSDMGISLFLFSQMEGMSAEDVMNAYSENGQGIQGASELMMLLPDFQNAMSGDGFGLLKYLRESGMMNDKAVQKIRDGVAEQFGAMSDTMVTQMGTSVIQKEYKAIGIDMGKLQMDYLKKIGLRMLGISVLMMVAAILAGFLASVVGASIGRDLRRQVFGKVVSFSNEDMNQFSTASLITRCTNDIQQVQQVSTMILRMVLYAPIIGLGGVLKVVDTKTGMGWIILLAVGLIVVLVLVLMAAALPKFKIMQKLVDRLNLVSREILTGLSVIRTFHREKYEEQRFEAANIDLTKTQLFTNRVMTMMMPAMMFIMNGIVLMIIWFGGKGIEAGNLQVGDMMAFISYTMMIVISFLMLTVMSIILPRAGVAADRIAEVIRTETKLKEAAEPVTLGQKTEGVFRFEDVSFCYPNAKENALSHLDFTIEPGKITAVIGSTGCGKTTLVNLMMRFYDVTEGRITYDGTDIRELSLTSLRDQIGYVPQKGVLFSGTIASNIKYASSEISDAQMEKAAATAQAGEFIKNKKEGFESPISQGGSNVSGGQKQRLSIARAIAKQPRVYIFDDSFSALDYKTDAMLRADLAGQTKDCTVVIVAQRISTIMNAGQIIVLDDGNVAGIGTHEELMEHCEAYQEIARSQLSEEELKGGRAS